MVLLLPRDTPLFSSKLGAESIGLSVKPGIFFFMFFFPSTLAPRLT
jgi:hypothetical protein